MQQLKIPWIRQNFSFFSFFLNQIRSQYLPIIFSTFPHGIIFSGKQLKILRKENKGKTRERKESMGQLWLLMERDHCRGNVSNNADARVFNAGSSELLVCMRKSRDRAEEKLSINERVTQHRKSCNYIVLVGV